jgi:hypothetical protein
LIAFEKSAHAANMRLIIPPADKIAVLYFPITQGTDFNSMHNAFYIFSSRNNVDADHKEKDDVYHNAFLDLLSTYVSV